MKTWVKSSVIGLAVVFILTGVGFAGNGKGVKNGTGPINDIFAGEPFEITGVVVSVVPGQGLVIAIDDENTVTVYGLGPVWYWTSLGVERPAVGEEITATGYILVYNGIERYIAMSVFVEGASMEVDLRDPGTGVPLWR